MKIGGRERSACRRAQSGWVRAKKQPLVHFDRKKKMRDAASFFCVSKTGTRYTAMLRLHPRHSGEQAHSQPLTTTISARSIPESRRRPCLPLRERERSDDAAAAAERVRHRHGKSRSLLHTALVARRVHRLPLCAPQSIDESSVGTRDQPETAYALRSPYESTLVLAFVTHIDALLFLRRRLELLLRIRRRRSLELLLGRGRRRLGLHLERGRRRLGLLFHGLGWRRCWFGVAVTAGVMAGAG